MKLYYVMFAASLLLQACTLDFSGSGKSGSKSKNAVMGIAALAVSAQSDSFLMVPNASADNTAMSLVSHKSGANTVLSSIKFDSNAGDTVSTANDHFFTAIGSLNKVAVLTVNSLGATLEGYISTGTKPVHMYTDPDGKIWIMNDGNSGVDSINCSAAGTGSVTVIKDGAKGTSGSSAASLIKHLCIGKGHHKALFTSSPKRAFVSNITDSTVSVIDNDSSSSTYLTVLSTVSLATGAGPHGFGYSSVSGKVYVANASLGTVTELNPSTLASSIISTVKSGPAAVSPDGKYAVFPGVDTSSDSNHVTGKLSVVNVSSTSSITLKDIADVSPDMMMFSEDGKKLFVVSAQAGSGNQLTNLKQNVLLIYDSSALPTLTLLKEVTVGTANAGHRHFDAMTHGSMTHLFIPSGDGNLYTVDADSMSVTQTLKIGGTFDKLHFHMLGMGSMHSH